MPGLVGHQFVNAFLRPWQAHKCFGITRHCLLSLGAIPVITGHDGILPGASTEAQAVIGYSPRWTIVLPLKSSSGRPVQWRWPDRALPGLQPRAMDMELFIPRANLFRASMFS